MICPKCQCGNVLAERHDSHLYRGRRYSTIALILDHLDHMIQEHRYREDGALCECMNCGYQWRPKQEERRARYRTHILKLLNGYSSINYLGVYGAVLNIDSERVMISLTGKRDCIIPYDELAFVDHRESRYPFYGRLSIRDRAHSQRSLPKSLRAAQKDRFTILYHPDYLKNYTELSAVLKAIVEENKKAGLIK